MFDADRLTSTVAPASAANDDGGIGTQTSSQISTWNVKQRQVRRPGTAGRRRTARRAPSSVTVARAARVAGAELARLVELAVVRQVGLRHDAEHAAAADDGGAVEEQVVDAQRQADDRHRPAIAARRLGHACRAPPRRRRAGRAGGTGRRRCRPRGPSSGKATSTAPCAAACAQQRRSISAALNAGSATLKRGTATATRAKSCAYGLKKSRPSGCDGCWRSTARSFGEASWHAGRSRAAVRGPAAGRRARARR